MSLNPDDVERLADAPEARPVSAPRETLVEMFREPFTQDEWERCVGTPSFNAFLARLRDADVLAERCVRLRAILDEVQFADNSGGEYPATCQVCEGHQPRHKVRCRLAALLKEGT